VETDLLSAGTAPPLDSTQGAQAFATVRSYLSTIRKRGINDIEAVLSIYFGDPLLIARPLTG
jgi:hypothetical protein